MAKKKLLPVSGSPTLSPALQDLEKSLIADTQKKQQEQQVQQGINTAKAFVGPVRPVGGSVFEKAVSLVRPADKAAVFTDSTGKKYNYTGEPIPEPAPLKGVFWNFVDHTANFFDKSYNQGREASAQATSEAAATRAKQSADYMKLADANTGAVNSFARKYVGTDILKEIPLQHTVPPQIITPDGAKRTWDEIAKFIFARPLSAVMNAAVESSHRDGAKASLAQVGKDVYAGWKSGDKGWADLLQAEGIGNRKITDAFGGLTGTQVLGVIGDFVLNPGNAIFAGIGGIKENPGTDVANPSTKRSVLSEGQRLYDTAARELLGVSDNASPAEVQKAYRKMAIQTHPDKPGGGNETLFKAATQAKDYLLGKIAPEESAPQWEDLTKKPTTSEDIPTQEPVVNETPVAPQDPKPPATTPASVVTPDLNTVVPLFQGVAYRADTGFQQDKGTTALDVVNFEAKDLGNTEQFQHLPPGVIDQLKNVPAQDIVWVTKTKSAAKNYGNEVGTVDLGKNPRVLAQDGDQGYLVLKNADQYLAADIPSEGPQSPGVQDSGDFLKQFPTELHPLIEVAPNHPDIASAFKAAYPDYTQQELGKTIQIIKDEATKQGVTVPELYSQWQGAGDPTVPAANEEQLKRPPEEKAAVEEVQQGEKLAKDSYTHPVDTEATVDGVSKTINQGVGDTPDIISQEDATKTIRKFFPASEVGITFQDKILTPEGTAALGKYQDKMISLLNDPSESVAYHEAVHAYMDLFTPPDLKQAVLDSVRAKFKLKSDAEAEEKLADGFIDYAKGKDVTGFGKIVDFFKKFYQRVQAFFDKSAANNFKINEFYDRIINKDRPAEEVGRSEMEARFKRAEDNSTNEIAGLEGKYEFADPNIEKSWQDAKGYKDPLGLWDHVRQWGDGVWKRFREYPEIPRTATSLTTTEKFVNEYITEPEVNAGIVQIRLGLRQLQTGMPRAKVRAVHMLQNLTAGLGPDQVDFFSKYIDLQDTAWKQGQGMPVPHGMTPEFVSNELTRMRELLKDNPAIQKSIDNYYSLVDAVTADSVELGLLDKNQIGDRAYFHNQVLFYQAQDGWGPGKAVKKPTPGFSREIKGTELAHNTNFLEASYSWLVESLYDQEVMRFLKGVEDAPTNIKDELSKEADSLGAQLQSVKDIGGIANFTDLMGEAPHQAVAKAYRNGSDSVDWRNLIPEGYVTWQPDPGRVFYTAHSVPESIVHEMQQVVGETLDLSVDDLRQVLAVGGAKKQLVIPKGFASTLDDRFKDTIASPVVLKPVLYLQGLWKIWVLQSPTRTVGYNLRNMEGDIDGVLAGYPQVFREKGRFITSAIQELKGYYLRGEEPTGDLAEMLDRGQLDASLSINELSDLKEFASLQAFYSDLAKNPLAKANIVKKYFSNIKNLTAMRESIMRLAVYKAIKADLAAGTDVGYIASLPEEVDNLPTDAEKAGRLATDLLGDYGGVSNAGVAMSKYIYPFWRWTEINFRRYRQIIMNEFRKDPKGGLKVTMKTAGKGTFNTAKRIGMMFVRISALWTAVTVYNHLAHRQEEAELPDYIKENMHFDLGIWGGKDYYMSMGGALGDILDWFGLNNFPNMVGSIMSGRKTVKETLTDIRTAALSKATSPGPLITMPLAMIAGVQLWPDPLNPRAVKDKVRFGAQQIGLQDEYDVLVGQPHRNYWQKLGQKIIAVASVDPGESSYYKVQDEVRTFNKANGKGGSSTFYTPRSQAAYLVKSGLKFGDKKAVDRGIKQLRALGVTQEQFRSTIQSMKPLAELSDKEKMKFFVSALTPSEQAAFNAQVNDNNQAELVTRFLATSKSPTIQDLRRAKAWYENVINQEDIQAVLNK